MKAPSKEARRIKKSESLEEDAEESGEDEQKPLEQDGAIHCKHCQMWLNGPAQWADHGIGKRHRKAARRLREASCGKVPPEKIPAMPEGSGKRSCEKGIGEGLPDDVQFDRESISRVEGSGASEQPDFDPDLLQDRALLRAAHS